MRIWEARSTPLSDGKVRGLQVTDCAADRMQVRVLVGAATASDAWDLRCLVRERLIAFVQSRFPEALPRLRAEVTTAAPLAATPSRI